MSEQQTQERMGFSEWLQMLRTDRQSAEGLRAARLVDFPPGVEESLAGSESSPVERMAARDAGRQEQPYTLERAQELAKAEQTKHNETLGKLAENTPSPTSGLPEVQEVAADKPAMSFRDWQQLSKTNPSRARDYHAAGKVEIPMHIAEAMGLDDR